MNKGNEEKTLRNQGNTRSACKQGSYQIDELNKKIDEIYAKMNKHNEEKNNKFKGLEDRLKKELGEMHTNHEMLINTLISSAIPQNRVTLEIKNFAAEFDFDSKKTNKSIHSKSVFCLNGYKAKLEVCLNGNDDDDENTRISIFFQIIKGPLDDSLE